MKRLLNLLLVFIVAMPFINAFSVSAENDNILSQEAATVLMHLGIAERDDSGKIDTQAPVSRAAFADYAARLLNTGIIGEEKVYYIDVPLSHWASKSVSLLYNLKLISPSDDRRFRPDDIITYNEACKILICAAGYGVYAERNGGYPSGYIKTASYMKLTTKISGEKELNVGETLELMYRAFAAARYDPYKFNEYGAEEYKVSEESLLYIHQNIAFDKGVVRSTYGQSIDRTVIEDRGDALVDDRLYHVSDSVDPEGLLGCTVDIVYVSYKNTNSKYMGEIIYAEASSGAVNPIEISSKDITNFDKGTYTITYYKSNSMQRKLDIPKDIKVIYNGMPTLRALGEIVSEFTSKSKIGTLRLVGSGDRFDTIIIDSYESFVLREFDRTRGYLYDEVNPENMIDIDSYNIVNVVNEKDLPADISELSAGNALSVAISDDKSIVKIRFSTQTTVAELSDISISGPPTVTFNGNEYDVEYGFYEKFSKEQNVGKQYTFIIDSFGRVVYAKRQGDSGNKAAYLIAASIDWYRVSVKMFTGDGEMKIIELADRVTVDGRTFKGDDAKVRAIDAIPGTTGIYDMNDPYSEVNKPVLSPQVILYSLNDQSQISKIDTCYVNEDYGENAGTSLTKTPSQFKKKMAQHIYASTYYRFDTDIIYSKKDTLVFCIPYADAAGNLLADNNKIRAEISEYAGGADKIRFGEEDYSLNTVNFLSGRSYMVEGYRYNPSNPYNDIILCVNPLYTDYDAPIMVSEISEALNADGDAAVRIIGYAGGVEVICDVNKSEFPDNLNKGDLIRGYMSADGKLTDIKKVYDVNENKILNKPGTYNDTPEWWYDGTQRTSLGYMYFNPTWQMSLGYVSEKTGNIVRWSYTDPAVNEDRNHFDEVWDLSVIPITVFDRELKKDNVYKGTVADITDYKSGVQRCSKIILFSRSSSVISAYVYK